MSRAHGASKANKGQSQRSHTSGAFTGRQTGVLVSLTIIMLVLVAVLGYAMAQSVLLIYDAPDGQSWIVPLSPTPRNTQPAAQSTPSWTATSSPKPTETPPALTPTPTQIQNHVNPAAPPTAALPDPPTPVPSLTPYNVYIHEVIGYSVEGRPIEVHRFGIGQHERLIVAGIHGGNEWNTIALAQELTAYLRDNQSLIPADTSLYILPALNPDGEARSHSADGRANANGVDLNRNWDADWQASWPRSGCWNLRHTTAGPYPGSEPETQALMNFILNHNIEAMISYHSAALGILPSGDPYHPNSVRLAEAISLVSPYRYPPIDNGCRYTGTLVDWALKQGIVGVDLELRDHVHTEFAINLRVLSLLLNWQP